MATPGIKVTRAKSPLTNCVFSVKSMVAATVPAMMVKRVQYQNSDRQARSRKFTYLENPAEIACPKPMLSPRFKTVEAKRFHRFRWKHGVKCIRTT